MKRFLAALLLTSCVTAEPALPPKLLPSGVYHHDVSLVMEGKDPQQFAGLLKIDGEKLTMIMLSPFGTTLARITDDLHQEADQLVIYADEMREYGDRIATIYRALKPAFIDTNAAEARIYGRTLTITHAGSVPPGVPKVTTITGQGIRMAVEVTSYETLRR